MRKITLVLLFTVAIVQNVAADELTIESFNGTGEILQWATPITDDDKFLRVRIAE